MIDKEKKYENVYNRYAHILIELTNEDTNFELITQDTIKLNINIEDIDILKIDYIVSQEKIDILNYYNNHEIELAGKLIYGADGYDMVFSRLGLEDNMKKK